MKPIARAVAALSLCLAAVQMPAVHAQANRAEIQITLSNFSFNPNMLRLQRNMPYTLHLTNSASGGHSFSATEFFAAAAVAPEDKAKIANGRIEIPAGQTLDVTLTPMTAGSYPIVCTHFLHQSFGMHGTAVVE